MVAITHTFVSPKGDGTDATLVQPSAWNAQHTITFAATKRVAGRNSAAGGAAEEVSASQILDWIDATRGDVLFRGAAGWQALGPGSAGQQLTSGGVGADPSWSTAGAPAYTTFNPTTADANFSLGVLSTVPSITFDSADVLNYDRTNNAYNFYIGGAIRAQINAGGIMQGAAINYLAPLPQVAAGVGQMSVLTTAVGASYTLPAGGTWFYQLFLINASGGTVAGFIGGFSAGGATIGSASTGNAYYGFIWRIA